MAEPFTILATVASVAGSAMSAVGAIQQGQMASAAAEYNARVAEMNARVARQQGAVEAGNIRRNVNRMLGTGRANIGASGVTAEGSPLDVLAETAALGRADELTAIYNAELRATSSRAQAQQYRLQGSDAASAGYIGAASSLLTGAMDVYRINRRVGAPIPTG